MSTALEIIILRQPTFPRTLTRFIPIDCLHIHIIGRPPQRLTWQANQLECANDLEHCDCWVEGNTVHVGTCATWSLVWMLVYLSTCQLVNWSDLSIWMYVYSTILLHLFCSFFAPILIFLLLSPSQKPSVVSGVNPVIDTKSQDRVAYSASLTQIYRSFTRLCYVMTSLHNILGKNYFQV